MIAEERVVGVISFTDLPTPVATNNGKSDVALVREVDAQRTGQVISVPYCRSQLIVSRRWRPLVKPLANWANLVPWGQPTLLDPQ